MATRIEKLMTRAPAVCGPDTPLAEVARMMVERDCGAIPVVDGIHDRPVGIVTDRDITVRAVAARQNPMELSAGDVMTSPCATLQRDATLEDCMQLMEERRIRRVVVTDDEGACVGIVAQADIARLARPEDTAEVVQSVSEPEAASTI